MLAKCGFKYILQGKNERSTEATTIVAPTDRVPPSSAPTTNKQNDCSDNGSGHSANVFERTRLALALREEKLQLDHELQARKQNVYLDHKNVHLWTVFVRVQRLNDAEGADVSGLYIKRVKFTLHPTFQPPVVYRRKAPFEVEQIGWGTFDIGIKITLLDSNDQEPLIYEHELSFSRPITSRVYQHGTFQIEVGNTYSCADEASQGDNQRADEYNQGRKQRKRRLKASKRRCENALRSKKQLESLLQSIPKERHDMALGAYLAGVYRGNLSTDYLLDLYQFATDSLRYVVLTKETRDTWRDYIMNWKQIITQGEVKTLEVAFSLSQPLPRTERIDIFVSHCWSDGQGQAKADLLEKISQDFQAKHGRLPRLWLDMFCMPQTDRTSIAKNVAALPLFLKACDITLVLYTKRLFSRLWCLVEVYTAYILSPLEPCDALLRLYPLQGEGTSGKDTMFIQDAQCGLKKDQELLFKNLEGAPGGLRGVEETINWLLSLDYLHMCIQP